MRIFLVEDEVMALRSLQRKIEDLNGDWEIVGTASNGSEALPAILLWEFFRTEQEDADKLSAEELVAQIEDYFRAHISENITLQSLSDEMGFPPSDLRSKPYHP